jgi:glucuronate isomerase
MRNNGISEDEITGNAPDRVKFERFAETLPKAIGNPMYHWTHLELKRYFGYDGILSPETSEKVWELCNRRLSEPDMTVRGIIKRSNVMAIGTTDDPADSLEWHIKLEQDKTFSTKVVPSFRPDKAVNIEKPGFTEYISRLSAVCNTDISNINDLKTAMVSRLDYFGKAGCRAADHGLDYVVYNPSSEHEANEIFKKALSGTTLTCEQVEKYKTYLLLFFAEEYCRRGWVMQLHYGTMRNINSRMFGSIGPDTGFDVMSTRCCCDALAGLLGALDARNSLPKTILYSLNPADNELLDAIIGSFQGAEVAGKLQHGSAWWFNDTKTGMEAQLTSLANLAVLGNFVGMLTDSRSFLSYTRHEYFRRIFCNLIGGWVENGEYPDDDKSLRGITEGVCYLNAKKYFGF